MQSRWHPISRYLPSPTAVPENEWIPWCDLLRTQGSYEGNGYVILWRPETAAVEKALRGSVQALRAERG